VNERAHEHPKVSVVIATYNHAAYLPMAVESVLGQTFLDYEIIVVNDGSTDNTDAVMQPYLSHEKVRYHTKPNGGQASAKNYGIREARGEYIAFLDADDFWEPTKLARQVKLLESDPEVGVVYSEVRVVGPAGEDIPCEPASRFRGYILPYLFGNNFLPFSSTMVRKGLLEAHGFFDEGLVMGIDYDLWLRLSLVTKFDYVPEAPVAYRIGHGQMSANVDAREYWAGLIEKRFREKHQAEVSTKMIRNSKWERTYARYRRYARIRPCAALVEIGRMFLLRPLYKTAYRSLGRLLWVHWQLWHDRAVSPDIAEYLTPPSRPV
jgi:glycosyltransferase involved in cell wall biosynthesis